MKTDRNPTPADLDRLAARAKSAAVLVYSGLAAPLCFLATMLLMVWGLPDAATFNAPSLLWVAFSVAVPVWLAAKVIGWLTTSEE